MRMSPSRLSVRCCVASASSSCSGLSSSARRSRLPSRFCDLRAFSLAKTTFPSIKKTSTSSLPDLSVRRPVLVWWPISWRMSAMLKDFGIADILQLIGHQTKTGRLTLKSGNDEVEVFFIDGNVVFASEKARKSQNLLGNLLLRAELLSPEQLDEALATQQRTLKRLGDILIESRSVTHQQF